MSDPSELVERLRDIGQALVAERRKLLAALYNADHALERAYCDGKGYTEEYGWPVGDHTPDSMADAIINRLARLRTERDAWRSACAALVEQLTHTARPLGPDEEMNEAEQTEQAYAPMLLAQLNRRNPHTCLTAPDVESDAQSD